MRSEQMLVALHLPRVKYVSLAVQGQETLALPLGWTSRRI